MRITLDRDYEVKCTLGTIKEIEKTFGKPFFALISSLDKLTTTEQLKMLYIGAKKADDTLQEEYFISKCDDYLGLGALSEHIENYILQLQYPGMSSDEIQKKIQKKLEQAESLRSSIGNR